MTADELRRLILERLASDGKIEAIKLYRELTRAGLADAKNAVEAMAEGRPFAAPSAPAATASAGLATVQGLIAAGRKIDAIKLYREQTGLGLAEAKDAVERMAAGHAAPSHASAAPSPSYASSGSAAWAEELIRAGRKIEAIKRYREETGLGLAEAKAAIDAIEAAMKSGAPVNAALRAAASGPAMAPFGSPSTGSGPAMSPFGVPRPGALTSSTPEPPQRKGFSSDDLEKTNPLPSTMGFTFVLIGLATTGLVLAYLLLRP